MESPDRVSTALLAEKASIDEQRSHKKFVAAGVVLFLILMGATIALYLRYNSLDNDTHSSSPTVATLSCGHPIYCTGELLNAVQLSQPPLFPDSKTFVDMPCRIAPNLILAAYAAQKDSPTFNLSAFVEEYFAPAGSEVYAVPPPDFVPQPPRLAKIQNAELRNFGYNVHQVWKNLTRRFNLTFSCGPMCQSSMPLPDAFVVPGGRFREFYYWDTYWIIRGLLVSNLTTTARSVLENMFFMVKSYGFVPNGARVYYVDRSQPPFLALMVQAYVDETHDTSILQEAIPLLHQEHRFWMETGHRVPSTGTISPSDVLNRYYATTSDPRPESYREDVATLQNSIGRTAQDLYGNLATGAESGWDYSTRWFANQSTSIENVDAQNVVPADLNGVLLQGETLMKNWTCAGGIAPDPALCSEYTQWANQRLSSAGRYFVANAPSATIGDFLLDSQSNDARWFGSSSTLLATYEFAANISAATLTNALDQLNRNTGVGGVPASLSTSGQQWDYPNAWSPVQFFSILALENGASLLNKPSYRTQALALAQTWITTTYCGYVSTGALFEKYNVTAYGAAGHGGEYVVQTGFGWTNGLILWILDRYNTELTTPVC